MPTILKNYLKLEKPSLFYFHYVFIETKDYLADRLFIAHEVPVHFGDEYTHDDWNYHIIFCKVRKNNEPQFLEALAELEHKMLLMGNKDYTDFCNKLMETMEQGKEQLRNGTMT